jgi:hypothetical protein
MANLHERPEDVAGNWPIRVAADALGTGDPPTGCFDSFAVLEVVMDSCP